MLSCVHGFVSPRLGQGLIGNRLDLIGNVKRVHLFFVVNGLLLLELFFLVQHDPAFRHPVEIYVPPVVAATLANIAFLGILENKLRRSRGAREPASVGKSEKILEKIVILNLWLQIGVLRLMVYLVTLLVIVLSAVFLYQIAFP